MGAQAAVDANGVVRRFGEKRAVDDVSFTVEPGEVFGLLGHNGAGKTTLIRVMNGLLPTDGGTIRTLGMDPVRQGDQVRARTGVLTEYPALDDFLTPAENLEVYAAVHGVPPDVTRQRVNTLIERLGLAAHVKLPARSLSAGLKQRLALARALIHDPELLLFDEPTSNLDPLAARGVRDLVHELSRERGRTVVLSTHNLIEAQDLCDRVAIIQHGQLLAVGSLGELSRDLDQGLVHFTVEKETIESAQAVLRGRAIVNVVVLPSGHTLAMRLPRSAIPDVVAELVHAGARVSGVSPQIPTLEDVYIALHASQGDLEPSAAGPS